MILGILFPEWPSAREWSKMNAGVKAQWFLLAGLQFAGIGLGGLTLLFA